MNLSQKKSHLKLLSLLIGLGLVIFFSLSLGEPLLMPKQIFWLIIHPNDHSTLQTIFWDLRLPRIFAACVAGALLALSGLLMQVMLQNSLADPYILGVSGGANSLNLVFILFNFSYHVQKIGTWLGAWISFQCMLFFAVKQSRSQEQLLLCGVMLSFIWSALISLILAIAPEHTFKTMFFWLLGDLNNAQLSIVEPSILILGLWASYYLSPQMAILSLGYRKAQTLGVHPKKMHIYLLLITSCLTAAAVSLAGSIGFIGLIIPHFMRRWGVTQMHYLILACPLGGAILLIFADTLARTLCAPQELPVGALMAFLGAPLFFEMIRKK